ncbi:Glycosyltransferase family 28, N-terminal domain [Phytophthora cactorum]|nr:Glycosyltransferase family 28, N-terminal domain [Phytophthora cactorum]
MKICMTMTGSWEGSVGQYVAIGKRLKADGHCVRLATNAVHRDRIVKAGLLSYPLGGSPTTITTFLEYIHQQAKDKKRHQSRLLNFPACVEADILTPGQAFRSDVIIAHPNLFGQTIVAERLGGPLHCMSDAPLYAPANAASYDVIDNLVWESMGDILDEFRYSLGLTGKTNANNLLSEWHWRSEITVTGRIDTEEDDDKFADIEQKLQSFDTGNSNTPTIYFGLQCDEWDSHRVQELVTCLEKAAKTANIGTDTVLEIDHHFPMKRILPYVKAAVHWGDLSTTSACLAAAKPAVWFMALVLALSGAGVQPLEIDSLTPSNLVRTFETLLDPKLGDCAKCLVPSFSNLPLTGMTCDLDPTLIARIYDSVHELKLSYEARLVVHQITGDGGSAGDLKYKPLKYSSHHPPKFSLRQLDTERLRSLSRSSSPTYQPTWRLDKGQISSKETCLTDARPVDALDVVEMPKFWSSPEEKTKCMKKINAKHEQWWIFIDLVDNFVTKDRRGLSLSCFGRH